VPVYLFWSLSCARLPPKPPPTAAPTIVPAKSATRHAKAVKLRPQGIWRSLQTLRFSETTGAEGLLYPENTSDASLLGKVTSGRSELLYVLILTENGSVYVFRLRDRSDEPCHSFGNCTWAPPALIQPSSFSALREGLVRNLPGVIGAEGPRENPPTR
jgi:hypothetical protein